MPRMSEAEKAKSRQRILDAAAATVRREGVEATSVGDVMKAAGLTHGGFYRHFASKEDLIAAAIEHATEGVLADRETKSLQAPREAALDYVADYLSDDHLHHRETGCPLAAIAGEAIREDGPIREAGIRAARRTARLLSGESDNGREGSGADIGYVNLSILIGSIVLARLSKDDSEADDILRAAQKAIRLIHKESE